MQGNYQEKKKMFPQANMLAFTRLVKRKSGEK